MGKERKWDRNDENERIMRSLDTEKIRETVEKYSTNIETTVIKTMCMMYEHEMIAPLPCK